MAKYCKLDSRKVTFREYWNIVHSPNVIIPWIAKLFRIPLPFGDGLPVIEDVRTLEIPESELPPEVKSALQSKLEQVQQLGFHTPTYHALKLPTAETYSINMVDPTGTSICKLMLSRSGKSARANLVVFITEFYDHSYLATSTERQKFNSAPNVTVHRLLKASILQLWDAHNNSLQQSQSAKQTTLLNDVEAMRDCLSRYEKASIDFQLKRGVYILLNENEEAHFDAKAEVRRAAAESGLEHGEVLAELLQQETKSNGWTRALVILAVSMLVFLGVGAARWSWKVAALLIPILLVHEFGHYIAMRSFGYRNLRMFFIPLFGAAVSGKNYNVPGWKKVIVSLMGPVPGIVLGCVLGGAGLFLHQTWMLKAAVMALILNGFNLIPVLPLDGGWVFHSLFFSRHYLLDTAFRAIAAVALIVGGPFSGNKFLMYVGIAMLMGLPVSYRLAKIANAVRARGLPSASVDAQTIPTPTAQAIITEVKLAFPKGATTKMLAKHTLDVFETLNARPPGWLATSGFVFIHVLSIGAAILFGSLFVVAQHGNLLSALSDAAYGPKHKFSCNSIISWSGPQLANVSSEQRRLIIATFKKEAEAHTSLTQWRSKLPPTAAAETYGSSLLISFSATDDETRKLCLRQLQQQTKDVFVSTTNLTAMFSCSCLARTEAEAKEIEAEANEYFSCPASMRLISPWCIDDPRPAGLRMQHRRARQSYVLLQNARSASYSDKGVITLEKQIAAALKQGDTDEANTLKKQLRTAVTEAEKRALEIAISEAPDREVASMFKLLPPVGATNYFASLQPIGTHLGQLPAPPAASTNGNAHNLFGYGGVSRNGLILQFNLLNSSDLFNEAPAFANWICSKGVSNMKYDFHAGFAYDDE